MLGDKTETIFLKVKAIKFKSVDERLQLFNSIDDISHCGTCHQTESIELIEIGIRGTLVVGSSSMTC